MGLANKGVNGTKGGKVNGFGTCTAEAVRDFLHCLFGEECTSEVEHGCNSKDDAGEAQGLACGLGSFGGMLSKEYQP